VDFIFWKRTPLLSLEGILKNPLIASLRHFRKTFAKEKGMQTPSLCRGEGFQKTTSCDTRVSKNVHHCFSLLTFNKSLQILKLLAVWDETEAWTALWTFCLGNPSWK